MARRRIHTKRFDMFMSPELKQRVEQAAEEFDLTTSDFVRRVLEEYLARYRANHPEPEPT